MEWPFTDFKPEISSNAYYIKKGSESQKIFTERSIAREIKVIADKYQECITDGYELLCVIPWHNAFSELANKPKLVFLCPVVFHDPGHLNVLSNGFRLTEFINDISEHAKYRVYIHPQLLHWNSIHDFTDNIFRKAATRLKTVHHFKARWDFNFRRNLSTQSQMRDILAYSGKKPEFLVLAGPQAEEIFPRLSGNNFWCADTALLPVLTAGLLPDLVFTIDAGHGSFEHFLNGEKPVPYNELTIIADMLSFPQILELPFKEMYSYKSSFPEAQNLTHPKTELYNSEGDVSGLMQAVFTIMYPGVPLPTIAGGEKKHSRYASHLRGSAYHRRMQIMSDRFSTLEMYMRKLSLRYS